MTISVLYVIGMIYFLPQNALHPGIALIGLVLLHLHLRYSALCSVLKELLKNAIEIKSENDLTV